MSLDVRGLDVGSRFNEHVPFLFLERYAAVRNRIERMAPVILHDIPFEVVPSEVRFLTCRTPAGFPSPAQDDMEELVDL